MGRLALGFERFAREIAAELRLADAAVAEDHQFDVLDAWVIGAGVLEIGAEGGEAIVLIRIRENARRDFEDVCLVEVKFGGALGFAPDSRNRAEAKLVAVHLL